MDNKKKLAYAIAKFLRSEMSSNTQEDESLEVAIQCLENAFGISADDASLDVGVLLSSMFDSLLARLEAEKPPANEETKAEAEKWKNAGNDRMRVEKFQEALECYTRAINLDGRNPVYYCNRAAAQSHLGNHQASIDDCKAAIEIEPAYGKGYGRLGNAYTNLNRYNDSKNAYLKALEFEPENETYRRNLEKNEELLAASTNPLGDAPPGLNMDNLTSMLGNQRLMSMASQMLSDPSMQSMLNNLMTGNQVPGGGGMDGLLQAGQRLAQMMQSSNPELVEQLRQQVGRGGDPPPGPQN